jgi:ubiquinone/menaquinone biosynthesis C-methylase UbiE
MTNSKQNTHGFSLEDWNEAFVSVDKAIGPRKGTIRSFHLPENARILEVGCGEGLNQRAFAELGYQRVFGIDISMELLRCAAGSARVRADAFRLPFADATFDALYLADFLHHIDVQRLFPELVRVLKPGGTIHISEPWPGLFRWLADFLTLYVLHGVSRTLHYRRIILLFEWNEYSKWLKDCRRVMAAVPERHGLMTVKKQHTMFDMRLSLQDSRS